MTLEPYLNDEREKSLVSNCGIALGPFAGFNIQVNVKGKVPVLN
jgi:hypothetical protein